MTNSNSRSTRAPRRVRNATYLALLLVDALFIGLHLVRAILNDTSYQGFLLDRRWSLELDRSYPEGLQYLFAGSTAAILLILYTLRRTLTYLGWMAAFLFILVDDSFSLHERFTEMFITTTGSGAVLGIEARVYAASILWGVVGLALLMLLALGYYRDAASRAFSRHLAYLLVALFFCGAVLDALHLLAGSADLGRTVTFLLGTLEDGGELVIVSMALAGSLMQLVAQRTPKPSGGDT